MEFSRKAEENEIDSEVCDTMTHKMDRAVRAFSVQSLLRAGALQRGSESLVFPLSDHINDGPFILSFSPRGLPWTSYLPLSLFWPPATNYLG